MYMYLDNEENNIVWFTSHIFGKCSYATESGINTFHYKIPSKNKYEYIKILKQESQLTKYCQSILRSSTE